MALESYTGLKKCIKKEGVEKTQQIRSLEGQTVVVEQCGLKHWEKGKKGQEERASITEIPRGKTD